MPKDYLPIYQIQDFNAQTQKEQYFYLNTFAAHLQEHLFIREPHKHDFYIILFISQGTGSHTIDFKQYEVKPNMVFFMIPGQVHSWDLSDDADGFVIFFTSEFYLKEFPQRKLFRYPFFNALLHKPLLYLSQTEESLPLQIIGLLRQEALQQELMKYEMLGRYLDILLIKLTRIYQSHRTEIIVQAGELAQLQTLENLIDQHYKEHLPVNYYADQLHVTAKQLNETCKQSLGKTTKALIQKRTLLEAQRLLVHSDLTSSQIAAELGYFDNTYFFRFFRKHTGCTPEQFRSANK
jgi:AraC family transcriptional activator of pobA